MASLPARIDAAGLPAVSLRPPCLGPAEAAGFYAAYRAFAGVASDPAVAVAGARDRKGRTGHDHN